MSSAEPDVCFQCGCIVTNVARCAACRFVRYCGRRCQRLAWRGGHREACSPWLNVMSRVDFASKVDQATTVELSFALWKDLVGRAYRICKVLTENAAANRLQCLLLILVAYLATHEQALQSYKWLLRLMRKPGEEITVLRYHRRLEKVERKFVTTVDTVQEVRNRHGGVLSSQIDIMQQLMRLSS